MQRKAGKKIFMNIETEYLRTAIQRLKYYKDLGEKSLAQLEEEDFHFSPGPESNSIAVIIQHMAGNMLSRFTDFLTTDGEKPWRQRDDEFEEQQLLKSQLMKNWHDGWACCLSALESLTGNDLLKTIYIRQEPLSVLDAINRQLAHYSYRPDSIPGPND
jgi:hypothetical protein